MIDTFFGEHRFLSNFYESPITLGGLVYPTAEHLYQCAKTDDAAFRVTIRMARTPGAAKRHGQRAPLRRGWEHEKKKVMLRTLLLKFDQNPHLAELLRETGRQELVEGNTWHDQYWGNCTCGQESCAAPGLNVLGVLLSTVRFVFS